MKTLETKRLIIRDWKESDAEDLFAYAKDSDVGPMAGWKPHADLDESKQILQMFMRERDTFAIEYKETNQVIGSVGLHKTKKATVVYDLELGYVLSKDFWGNGIMKEAAQAVIDYAFHDLGIETLMVGHFIDNQQSKRVIEKLGFTPWCDSKQSYTRFDGVKLDEKLYRMLNCDWKRGNYMKIDRDFLVSVMEELINVPSTVSYYDEIHPYLQKKAKELGYEVSFDRKRTAYVEIPGEDNSKTICLGAHVDTIGLMVRHINEDGTLAVRELGGLNFQSIEGESVVVHTRSGVSYTGMVICKSHSVHVFDDARTLPRDDTTMQILLDKDVSCPEDVLNLGIDHGDIISINPRFQYTEDGYIKSRHIDDKASAACLFYLMKYLKEHDKKPAYRTLFAFPIYEEINHGGAYVPPEVSEYVALDIALIGPDYHGSEYKVTICAKDAFSPYDRGLTTKLVDLAKHSKLDYCVDVFYRYGTDANAAIRAGNNVYAAAFGMGCMNTHGMERCHISAVEETAKLAFAYMMAK